MVNSFGIKPLQLFFVLSILTAFTSLTFAQAAEDDPFYGQKGTDAIIEEYSTAPFQDVVETVDPFTGNLNLLPGNGGLVSTLEFSDLTTLWETLSIEYEDLLSDSD